MSELHIRSRRPARGLLLAAVALTAAACGGEGEPSSEGPAGSAAAASSRSRRDMRPEAVEARRLLDMGRAALARPLVESLVAQLPVEGPLLRARLAVLEGESAAWLADVEAVRAADPADPRSYATAAELYAALDRRIAAKEEIERGIAAVGGLTPELQRAAGVLAIVTPGRTKAGLAMLEEAERLDPGLPFLGRALGQAHLLAAKHAFADGTPELALERIERSLAYDPEDFDARRMKGEYLMALKRFDEGLELLEELLAQGMPIGVELGNYHWTAGTYHNVVGDDLAARRHFLRARELGEPKVEQRSAKRFLDQEAQKAYERSLARLEAGDEDGCKAALIEAIGLHKSEASARRFYATRIAALAEARLEGDDLEGATPLVKLAVHVDREAPATTIVVATLYFERALEALGRDDAETALAFATQAATAGSEDPFMWHFLGELQYAARDFGAATGSLDRALTLSRAAGEELPLDGQLKLADSMVMMGREEDAKVLLTRAIATAEVQPGVDAAAIEKARELLRTL